MLSFAETEPFRYIEMNSINCSNCPRKSLYESILSDLASNSPFKLTRLTCIWRTTTCRSSRRRCSLKKGVLRNFVKLTGKHLCQSLLFNKVADLRLATLLKKRFWHRCFPVNFAKFLRTLFLQNTSRWLLLYLILEVKSNNSASPCASKIN